MEIQSLQNAQVKQWAKLKQKKYREESGRFLIEGMQACILFYFCASFSMNVSTNQIRDRVSEVRRFEIKPRFCYAKRMEENNGKALQGG